MSRLQTVCLLYFFSEFPHPLHSSSFFDFLFVVHVLPLTFFFYCMFFITWPVCKVQSELSIPWHLANFMHFPAESTILIELLLIQ